jgi:hypothetical protein
VVHHIGSLFDSAQQAVRLVLDRAVSINPWWLVAGVVLYEVAQAVRTRGWFNIVRAAYPDTTSLRARDVAAAQLAGVGLNSVLPARSGDFLKLFMVRRRAPALRYSTLVATFVPETLFESLCGTLLVIWALAHGFLPVPLGPGDLPEVDVSLIMSHPLLSLVGALVIGGVLTLLVRWLRSRARGLARRLRQGLTILRSPRRFVTGVASWQALGRVIRLAGLTCFLAALGLPVTPNTALLAMASQGAGRVIPIAPASAGIRVAMLSYGFVEITDKPVDVASVTGFWLALGAAHLVASVLVALVIVGVTFGTFSPRRALALATARRELQPE